MPVDPYPILHSLFAPLVRRLWLAEVRGLENVPSHGPVILVANHASYLDFLLICAVCKRKVVYLTGEALLRRPLVGWLLRAMGMIPVDRTRSCHRSALRTALSSLRRGAAVGVFPEGTRTQDGVMRPLRQGAAWLAMESGVPIVPVWIEGSFSAWPRQRRLPRVRKCAVRFGAPLTAEQYSGVAGDKQLLTQRIGTAITALSGSA